MIKKIPTQFAVEMKPGIKLNTFLPGLKQDLAAWIWQTNRYCFKIFIIAAATLVNPSLTSAQVDRTFWFAAPEITERHSHQPAVLRITAFDSPARVNISIPARNITLANLVIPANTQVRYVFPNLDDIENRPAGQINRKGILISSDVNISAYYEIDNEFNPEKFALKGSNALGTEFFIPSQNVFGNRNLGAPFPREQVDIVATENNTRITITLTDDIVTTDASGRNDQPFRSAGETFDIVLQRGETFSLRGSTRTAGRHLGGTRVVSDKPVAVTISDDSIEHLGTGRTHFDLVGDQLVPIDHISTEYIAINTAYNLTGVNNTGQIVFITATRDNTTVLVNGTPISPTLNMGEMTSFNIIGNAIHIEATNPVYVYQVSSVGFELGSAILPTINNCTGSREVAITRIYAGLFAVQILTRYSNIHGFRFTPNDGAFANLTWTIVPNTGPAGHPDTWYTAVVNASSGTFDPYFIENVDGLFHLSVLDSNGRSMSYGYFSAYNSIRIEGPSMACHGSHVVLTTAESALAPAWFFEDDLYTPISTQQTINVQRSGRYFVKANYAGCEALDYLDVVFRLPEFDLGPDRVVCPGEVVSFDIQGLPAGSIFNWTPGNITTNVFDIAPGAGDTILVSLTVTDDMGCSATKTTRVIGRQAVSINWDNTSHEICLGQAIRNTTIMHRYQWSLDGNPIPGATNSYIYPQVSGTYTLTAWTSDGCEGSYSRLITVNPLPVINLADQVACPNTPADFMVPGFSSYLWHNGATTDRITVNNPGTVSVTVTDANGCTASDDATLSWHHWNNGSIFDFDPNFTACAGNPVVIELNPALTNIEWEFTNAHTGVTTALTPSPGLRYEITSADPAIHSGTYRITADDANGCIISEAFTLTLQTIPDLSLGDFTSICRGDTIMIATPNHNFTRYEWVFIDPYGTTTPFGNNYFVLAANEGTYRLTAWQDNGCFNVDDISVNVIDAPVFDLSGGGTTCPGNTLTLEVQNWVPGAGGSPSRYVWRFSEAPVADKRFMQEITHATGYYHETAITGYYSVVVYDANNCFAEASTQVLNFDLPIINLVDVAICDNQTFTLGSSLLPAPVTNYQWYHVESSTTGLPNQPWVVNAPGEYRVIATDHNNCTQVVSMRLSLLPSPVFTLGPDRSVCGGEEIILTPGPLLERFEWNGNTAPGQPPRHNVTTSGNYSLRVINSHGCSATDDVNITVNPLPSIDLGNDITVCAGQPVMLSVPSFHRVQWSTGEINTSNIIAGPGRYSVKVTDTNGCQASDEIAINWHPLVDIELHRDMVVCPAHLPVRISAPAGFARYQWHNGSVEREIEADLLDTVNVVTVLDHNGCVSMQSKSISVALTPEFSLGNDLEACEPGVVVIDAGTTVTEVYNNVVTTYTITGYQWNTGSVEQSITVSTPGAYFVQATDGCFFFRDTVNVMFNPSPVIAAIDTSMYAQVTAFVEYGTAPFRYWLNNGSPQSSHTFRNISNGQHTIFVEDSKGCATYAGFQVNSIFQVNVPNFFTPNNDGFNDEWVIEGLERLPETTISVFDRYGKLLVTYYASDPPWNGYYLGRPLPSDDYWYVIRLQPINQTKKGNVTIIR